jgi:hypothetical protein
MEYDESQLPEVTLKKYDLELSVLLILLDPPAIR